MDCTDRFRTLRPGFAWPGAIALAGGTVLFLLATWLHPFPAGVALDRLTTRAAGAAALNRSQ